MIDLEIFLLGLMIVSTFTSLVTEAIKKISAEHNIKYNATTLAGIVSAVLSAIVGVCYVVITKMSFDAAVIICIVALVFTSWLCATVGYDKVIAALKNVKGTDNK